MKSFEFLIDLCKEAIIDMFIPEKSAVDVFA